MNQITFELHCRQLTKWSMVLDIFLVLLGIVGYVLNATTVNY